MPQTYRILSYNVGFCCGLNGSLRHYVLHGHRHVLRRPKKVHAKVVSALQTLIQTEHPDLCCFTEVDHTMMSRVHNGLTSMYEQAHSGSKYGAKSVFRKLPAFRKRRDGFLAREQADFTMHYLHSGMKKLLYEIQLSDDLFVFMGHFALRQKIRRKQFTELTRLLQNKKKIILCGDFNVFKGFGELRELMERYDLKIVNSAYQATFPTCKPRKCVDLFLCSRDIDVRNIQVLRDTRVSDHLPVLMEVRA